MKNKFFNSERWNLIRQDVIRTYSARFHLPENVMEKYSDWKILRLLISLLKDKRYAFSNILEMRGGRIAKVLCRVFPPSESVFLWIGSAKGGGLLLWHPVALVINAEHIGSGCVFRNNTTIGNKTDKNGNLVRPWLGDNVDVGVGVCIIGNVHIGNNVKIGAGAVVVKDVPDNCVVVGNPAYIIMENGVKCNKKL